MKKLAIVLSLISLSIYLSYSLLAVPEGKHIWLEKDLNSCFHRNEDNSFKIKWNTNIYDQNKDESWAPVDQGKNNEISKIEINPNNAIYNLSATSGECLVQVNEPGEYTINVTIVYKEQSNGFTTSVNKVLYVNFYEVKEFKLDPSSKVIGIEGMEIVKNDFHIMIEPSSGKDLFEWSKDDSQSPGQKFAYLKLNDHECAKEEFLIVKVTFDKDLVYIPDNHGGAPFKILRATVEPETAITLVEFNSFPLSGIKLNVVNETNGQVSIYLKESSEGYREYEYYCNTKISKTRCGTTKIVKVHLNWPDDLTVVNGEEIDIQFTTEPENIGELKQLFDSSKEHVGELSGDAMTFITAGNREVFKDVPERDKETTILDGEVGLKIAGQDDMIFWKIDSLNLNVTNAPPKFMEKLDPQPITFNTPSFTIMGAYVRYSDIDDNSSDYKTAIGNTKNDGVIKDAITEAEVVSKTDVESDGKIEMTFSIDFNTKEGVKIFRMTPNVDVAIGEGVSVTANVRFEIPISEKSRFLTNTVLNALYHNLPIPSGVEEKISNIVNRVFGIDQYTVHFTPDLRFSSGKNVIVVDDDSKKGLPFESTTVMSGSQKIIASYGGVVIEF